MKFLPGVVIVLVLQLCDLDGRELPAFIKKCKRSDPQLNECMKRAIMDMRTRLQNGVKQLKLPPFDPYFVLEAQIATSWMNGTLTNLTMRHTNNYEIDLVHVDLERNPILLVKYLQPYMELKSHYKIDGMLQQFAVHSEGELELSINNTKSVITLEGHKIQKNGKEYMNIDKGIYKIRGSTVNYLYLHNLFGNNQELTDSFNSIFLQNKDVYYEEFSPVVEKIVTEVSLSWFKGVFDTFSLDELFD